MTDMFENVASKFRNSPSALVLFIAAFAMLAVGINHFVEDVYSSYAGLIAIEQHFNMNVQVFDWTYWTMSIAPQLASIVYFYIYLANTDKKWALWVSVLSQSVDFLSDLWYRSNGSAFTNWGATGASALVTFAFFTMGSEVFITVGSGLCLKLAAPALHAWRYYRKEVEKVKSFFDRGGYQEKSEGNKNKPSFGGFEKTSHDSSPNFEELERRMRKSGENQEKSGEKIHRVKYHSIGKNHERD